jgi:hypothetical protein
MGVKFEKWERLGKSMFWGEAIPEFSACGGEN